MSMQFTNEGFTHTHTHTHTHTQTTPKSEACHVTD